MRVAGVWDQLGFLFDTDDGSLPYIWVTGLSREGVAAAHRLIRSRSRTNRNSVFWHVGLDREERLDAWPDAALLVADSQAAPFYFLACGMAFGGVVLPDLGVIVFPGDIRLDYRMGPEWCERRVLALFELLRRLVALSPDARVTLEPDVLPSSVERMFQAAFSAYCRDRPVGPVEHAAPRERASQWRECENPDTMLALLGGEASQRRLRLFSAACCRRVWHLLEEPAFRQAVEAAERFAEGRATSEEWEAACQVTLHQQQDAGLSDDPLANARLWAADAACDLDRTSAVASGAAWAVAWASGLPVEEAYDRERVVQCELLRCIFRDPLRSRPKIDPAWLAWGAGVVRKLAYQIRESGRFEDMPVLADALEDAGCGDEVLLAHLRGPGPHARGCHVVGLLLGDPASDAM
jgi:hypothetical protein